MGSDEAFDSPCVGQCLQTRRPVFLLLRGTPWCRLRSWTRCPDIESQRNNDPCPFEVLRRRAPSEHQTTQLLSVVLRIARFFFFLVFWSTSLPGHSVLSRRRALQMRHYVPPPCGVLTTGEAICSEFPLASRLEKTKYF